MRTLVAACYACAVLFMVMLFGCSAAGGASPDAPQNAFWPLDDASWQAFDAVAPRLAARAGVTIVSSPMGIPVRTAPRPDGATNCAQTTVTYMTLTGEFHKVDRIDLWLPIPGGCFADLSDSLAHETIHALRAVAGLTVMGESMTHSVAGIFAASSDSSLLEETSLEMLCEAADCDTFEPESAP
jgi:hypothetical protein